MRTKEQIVNALNRVASDLRKLETLEELDIKIIDDMDVKSRYELSNALSRIAEDLKKIEGKE